MNLFSKLVVPNPTTVLSVPATPVPTVSFGSKNVVVFSKV